MALNEQSKAGVNWCEGGADIMSERCPSGTQNHFRVMSP